MRARVRVRVRVRVRDIGRGRVRARSRPVIAAIFVSRRRRYHAIASRESSAWVRLRGEG